MNKNNLWIHEEVKVLKIHLIATGYKILQELHSLAYFLPPDLSEQMSTSHVSKYREKVLKRIYIV